jgi:hypothetical protein
MTLSFELDQEQYEALIGLAREGTKNDAGTVDPDKARSLDAFLKSIESSNGITRDAVWVQWQELDQPLPAGTLFPSVWPPELRVYIEYVTRKVTRADVDNVIATQATNPLSVLVTKDPGATLGWTELANFFK